SNDTTNTSIAVGTRVKPPPYQLLGHEHLFHYYGIQTWLKDCLKHSLHLLPSTTLHNQSYEHILRQQQLPIIGGPVAIDGTSSLPAPNDSFVTFASQQLPPPLLPRHIDAAIKRDVLTLTPYVS